ncbi:hypothetical protein ABWL39_20745 [Chitinivorax sp. PXF-14]|uniref:hypothetical protein n=1 Tax=Chitinivorax sp. PXF-14 TaxID=3230488 RepID=UPI0034671B34
MINLPQQAGQVDTFTRQSGTSTLHMQAMVPVEPGAGTPLVASATPQAAAAALPVRPVGEDIWVYAAAASLASAIDATYFVERARGANVTVAQSGGNLLVGASTDTNAEWLARSKRSWRGAWIGRLRHMLSQRIANNNFQVLLADKIGEGLACTVNSATSVTVALPGHAFTDANVGQSMMIGAISGVAGVPGRYSIASVVPGVSLTFTVAGWPVGGNCAVDLFGWNNIHVLFNGATATNALFDCQRSGWAAGDVTITSSSSASPGHLLQLRADGRQVHVEDGATTSSTALSLSGRGSRIEHIPDDSVDLYLYLWSFNAASAPASATTWTIGFCSIEQFANLPVYIAGNRAMAQSLAMPVTLVGGTANIGSSGGAVYTESSTALGAGASTTGASRDAGSTVGYARFVANAFADQAGTLYLEKSTDNVTWRLAAPPQAVAAGEAREVAVFVTARYHRARYVNGATAQAAFLLTSALLRI